jgi:acyl carrier protein
MWGKQDIDPKLKEMIITTCRNKVMLEDICDTTNIMTDLGIDSLVMMQLIVEVEVNFGFRFTDEDLALENLVIYKKLLDKIEHSLNKVKL